MQRENVVLVLTGDDSGLSAPLTFESLRAQSLLPARTDCTASNDEINAILVPLALAVRFVADLERSERSERTSLLKSICLSGLSISRVSCSMISCGHFSECFIQRRSLLFWSLTRRAVTNGNEAFPCPSLASSKIEHMIQGKSQYCDFVI